MTHKISQRFVQSYLAVGSIGGSEASESLPCVRTFIPQCTLHYHYRKFKVVVILLEALKRFYFIGTS